MVCHVWHKTPAHTYPYFCVDRDFQGKLHITRTNKLATNPGKKNQTRLVCFQTSCSLGSQSWPGELRNPTQTTMKKTHFSLHSHTRTDQPEIFPPKHHTHAPHHTQSNLSTYRTPELPHHILQSGFTLPLGAGLTIPPSRVHQLQWGPFLTVPSGSNWIIKSPNVNPLSWECQLLLTPFTSCNRGVFF